MEIVHQIHLYIMVFGRFKNWDIEIMGWYDKVLQVSSDDWNGIARY